MKPGGAMETILFDDAQTIALNGRNSTGNA